MEAINSSEMLVYFHISIWHHIQDRTLYGSCSPCLGGNFSDTWVAQVASHSFWARDYRWRWHESQKRAII
jgi:hypothetical protein